MSWSVSAFGRASGVRESIAKQFAQGSKCMEPEETMRQAAAALLDSSLEAQDPSKVVEATASGSMSTDNGKVVSNSLSIKIDPKWGFIE
jgi:hypothetical protein